MKFNKKQKFDYLFRNALYIKLERSFRWRGTNAMKVVIYPTVKHDCSLITSNSDS